MPVPWHHVQKLRMAQHPVASQMDSWFAMMCSSGMDMHVYDCTCTCTKYTEKDPGQTRAQDILYASDCASARHWISLANLMELPPDLADRYFQTFAKEIVPYPNFLAWAGRHWSILQLIHGCIMLHPKNTWCAGSFNGAPWNADSNGLLGVTPPWMKQRSAWNIREKASRSALQRNGMRSIATCYPAVFIRPPVAWGAITFSKDLKKFNVFRWRKPMACNPPGLTSGTWAKLMHA